MMTSPGFEMPQHDVDQYAAAMRDSGMPNPVMKIVAGSIAMVVNQLGDSIDLLASLGVDLDAKQMSSLLRDFAGAWTQLKDTL